METATVQPEQLAERYLSAVEDFIDAVHSVPAEVVDWRERADTWSARDIAFHVADVDQMLGLRLRRILVEEYPALAGIRTQATVQLYRKSRLDLGLAVDALRSTGALNTALLESVTPAVMARKGRHSEGHDVSAADLAAFMAMHIEAHVRQIKRVLSAAR
jgi:hypothetical protein